MQKDLKKPVEKKPSRAVAITKWQPIDLKTPAFAKKMTPRSLELVDNLEKANWLNIGKVLQGLTGSLQWWFGDWWAFGETVDLHYGDLKQLYVQDDWDAGFPAYQTLANWAVVSRAFAPDRRIYDLPYTFYKRVCSYKAEEQDELLKWCIKEDKTLRELNDYIYKKNLNKEIDKAAKSDPPEKPKIEKQPTPNGLKEITKFEEDEPKEPVNEKLLNAFKRATVAPLSRAIIDVEAALGKIKHVSTKDAAIIEVENQYKVLEDIIVNANEKAIVTLQPKKK
jgi:hypothetical protein